MIEWTQPARIVSPFGTLLFNAAETANGERYLLDQSRCRVVRGLRVTTDPVPQGDGEIFHRRFTDGIELTLSVQLWKGSKPACDGDARLMYEALAHHLSTMLNDDGRFYWQPEGWGDERMLYNARWLSPTSLEYGELGLISVEFTLDSPLPYFLDKTQRIVTVPNGATVNVPMVGNADFWPVLKAQGAFTSFLVANGNTSEGISYDGARPGAIGVGAGSFAELDMFRNTIYLNGTGASMKAGVDPLLSDYFYLQPGDNFIEALGANIDFLVNDAWLP